MFQKLFSRGVTINWASLIIGSKFTVFACFSLYLRAVFQVQAPGGLMFGGAHFWNFTAPRHKECKCQEFYS